MPIAFPPDELISDATSLAFSSFKSSIATDAPHSASALENAEQSTPPPPVTTAFLPDKSTLSIVFPLFYGLKKAV